MESKFISLDKVGEEAKWLRNFLNDIPYWPKPLAPICIHCDSQVAICRVKSMMYSVTSSHRKNCTRPSAPEMEHVCGRPLGLRFNMKTGDLYIADAYLGLQVVGPKGGLATPLVQKFKGKPLLFTNDVDVDDHDDVIYFTDTSTKYQRRQFLASFSSGDATGRLMKYVKSTKKITVVLGGLAFANGVTLSKNRTFVFVAETTNFRILRYWLKGPLAGTHDTFAELPGFPDNIRINSKGELWVALQAVSSVLSI
ncbi:protein STRICTOSIDINE SYNTHASE-LIKE 10-like [Capsicum galapagoense]